MYSPWISDIFKMIALDESSKDQQTKMDKGLQAAQN